MKNMIFTIAAFAFILTGTAQNEKPTKPETNPDTTASEKANYNTTRTNKTIKKEVEEKGKKKSKLGKSGGGQSHKAPIMLFHDKFTVRKELKIK